MNQQTKDKIEAAAKEHFSYNEGDTWIAFKRGAEFGYQLKKEESVAEIEELEIALGKAAIELGHGETGYRVRYVKLESQLECAREALEFVYKHLEGMENYSLVTGARQHILNCLEKLNSGVFQMNKAMIKMGKLAKEYSYNTIHPTDSTDFIEEAFIAGYNDLLSAILEKLRSPEYNGFAVSAFYQADKLEQEFGVDDE